MADNGVVKNSGPKSKDPMPECTREYYPAQGGEMGDTFESEGAPGDKDGTGMSAVTGNTDIGEYQTAVNTFGDWPHGANDPDVEGPPIGADSQTVGPNGAVDMGAQTPSTMPNDRAKSGY